MQVKKFEAPTIQEALDVIKRELGPEAIILSTKKLKKAFGLMNRESVEVTAAVSERSIQKKSFAENRLRDSDKEAVKKLSAGRQGDLYDKYFDKSGPKAAPAAHRLTATRYAEITDGPKGSEPRTAAQAARAVGAQARAQAAASQLAASARSASQSGGQPAHQAQGLEQLIANGAARPLPSGAIAAPLGAGMTVEEELRHLKRMVEEMKTVQEGVGATATGAGTGGVILGTPALQDAFEQLALAGLDKRYAYGLVKRVAFDLGETRALNPEEVLDQLAAEIMETTEVHSSLDGIAPGNRPAEGMGPAVIALVGPTGVGKTTTVAKIASDALLKRKLKVGLINLDSYKVAAFDHLGTYAKILNVPFRSVTDGAQLQSAIQDFKSLDLILVDTTGRSQRDPASLQEMQEVLGCVTELRTQLVLAVATRDGELYEMASRFGVFKPEGIIFSKLDEATSYGSVYNVSQKTKLPLLYFTTGQRVPEDLEEASRERVAALVMDL